MAEKGTNVVYFCSLKSEQRVLKNDLLKISNTVHELKGSGQNMQMYTAPPVIK